MERNGHFPARYAPFDVTANANGLANLQHPDGQTSFNERFQVLQAFNQANPLRVDFDQMRDFYASAQSMMNDPNVNNVFRFTATDQTRYGNSGFGSSCIVARNLIGADMGTRYFQINLGGWDNHSNIYQANGGIYGPARQLDLGLGNLIADLAGLPGDGGRTRLDETLIVVKGEFGRTVGNVNNQGGRDHYSVHSTLFAGGGIIGGRAIGGTTADGRFIDRPGWSQDRQVGPEDIAATMYSALGINYTTKRRDDPLGRGFEMFQRPQAGPHIPLWSCSSSPVPGISLPDGAAFVAAPFLPLRPFSVLSWSTTSLLSQFGFWDERSPLLGQEGWPRHQTVRRRGRGGYYGRTTPSAL